MIHPHKTALVFLLCLSVGLCMFYLTYITKRDLNSDNQIFSQQLSLKQQKSKNGSLELLPKVLLWTPMFSSYELAKYGISPTAFDTCPVECKFTNDKSHLETSNALIFHARDINR